MTNESRTPDAEPQDVREAFEKSVAEFTEANAWFACKHQEKPDMKVAGYFFQDGYQAASAEMQRLRDRITESENYYKKAYQLALDRGKQIDGMEEETQRLRELVVKMAEALVVAQEAAECFPDIHDGRVEPLQIIEHLHEWEAKYLTFGRVAGAEKALRLAQPYIDAVGERS